MSAGRKPRGGVSFHVVEGRRDLHRQPLLPHRPHHRTTPAEHLRPAHGIGWAVLAGLLIWAALGALALHLFARI